MFLAELCLGITHHDLGVLERNAYSLDGNGVKKSVGAVARVRLHQEGVIWLDHLAQCFDRWRSLLSQEDGGVALESVLRVLEHFKLSCKVISDGKSALFVPTQSGG